ncbi:hypothetical protein [Streptomyces alkaliphilus]|uniref:LppX_LprAFG lipoprotein n=1 Tax=Streptomyces alkaliphilus TaxID=1472722 RepID=A0A7W3TAW3_9ACTN|nr:hypothetical protein [Streptomyces alkaliphilus]MBB0243486.1 hypothetical protein [Streptomyces alkaliphilus]MQS07694.1 hypothetical protein [Streptomyces alkaliphilus]
MRIVRKAALCAVTVGLVAVTAACGGDDDNDVPERADNAATEGTEGSDEGSDDSASGSRSAIFDALQASAQQASEAETVAFETTMTMSDGAEEFVLGLVGVMGWDPVAMDVTMDMGELGALMGQENATMNMRWLDNILYMGGPMFEAELDGASWVKMDLEAAAAEGNDAELEQMLAQLDQAERMAQSPAEQMGLLLQTPSLEHQGTEEIEGVTADLYTGTLTMDELLEADPSTGVLTEEELEEMRAELAAAGTETVDLSIWVDENDFPVRIDMEMIAEGMNVLNSTVYKDYGVALDFDHPAEADVVDFGRMTGGY